MEGRLFNSTTETTEEARIRMQMNVLIKFSKTGGTLWALEDHWTQLGVATGHSASFVVFNWSPSHISVSNFGFTLGLFFGIVVFYHLVNLRALGMFFARHY